MKYEWSEKKLETEPGRLKLQADMLFPIELPYLEELGITHGKRIADVGCGDGSWLSHLQAAADGHSVLMGVDLSEAILKIARTNVPRATFECSAEVSVAAHLESFRPDVIVMRFLHQHLSSQTSRDLFRAAKAAMQDGSLLVIDVDDASFSWTPASQDLRGLLKRRSAIQSKAGGDRTVGRKLAGRIRQAGFHDITVRRVKVSSRVIGLAHWWGIVAPVLTSGSSTREDDLRTITNWCSYGDEAEFSLYLYVARV